MAIPLVLFLAQLLSGASAEPARFEAKTDSGDVVAVTLAPESVTFEVESAPHQRQKWLICNAKLRKGLRVLPIDDPTTKYQNLKLPPGSKQYDEKGMPVFPPIQETFRGTVARRDLSKLLASPASMQMTIEFCDESYVLPAVPQFLNAQSDEHDRNDSLAVAFLAIQKPPNAGDREAVALELGTSRVPSDEFERRRLATQLLPDLEAELRLQGKTLDVPVTGYVGQYDFKKKSLPISLPFPLAVESIDFATVSVIEAVPQTKFELKIGEADAEKIVKSARRDRSVSLVIHADMKKALGVNESQQMESKLGAKNQQFMISLATLSPMRAPPIRFLVVKMTSVDVISMDGSVMASSAIK